MTQLAAALAHQWWRQATLDLCLWVDAGSRKAIKRAFSEAVQAIPGIELDHRGPPEFGFRTWLEQTLIRWLIVLDGLEQPGDLHELWPPASPTGATLITTRRRDGSLRGRRVELPPWNAPESRAYLIRALTHTPHRLTGATELAEALGHLPRALATAVTEIAEHSITCAEYTAMLTTQHDPDVPATGPGQDEWAQWIALADAMRPIGLASPLLRLASFLGQPGEPIPASLFTSPLVTGYLTNSVRRPVDATMALDGMSCLSRGSLLTWDRCDTVELHPLLRRSMRSMCPAAERASARQVAAALHEHDPTGTVTP
ncbi:MULTISPECIES: hypothetical protein [unclassified Crossiella]|uniref:hypothetical protein n=1 Tax=unclassified Crossiella TaxID=2620835 RepID=UPI001FFFA27C|nr:MULTISPECIES: hypothetical protein [unclassified Crossiella]MCK2245495.1 hypothetical protein [Crossiella sp. S99.2]MCK2259152.1 hypothetical protein [Crossiella sp. S99.1]